MNKLLTTRPNWLEQETDPEAIEAAFVVLDHPDWPICRKALAADLPGSGGGGPLPEGIVLDDGSTPFLAPQAGVAAVLPAHFATKAQLDSIAGSASTAVAAANQAVAAATVASRLPKIIRTDTDLVAGAYTIAAADLTTLLVLNFTGAATLNLPVGINTITVPGGGVSVACIDMVNIGGGNVTVATASPATVTGIGGTLVVPTGQGALIYLGSDNIYYVRRG